MKKVVALIVLVTLVFGGVWIYSDSSKNNDITTMPSKPDGKIYGDSTKVLWALENEATPEFDEIISECEFIDARYDKSDFSIQTLLRLMYNYNEDLPEEAKNKVKETILSFKYWMDQPGEDSMCYWSENHQILFATGEYLAGQLYSEELFINDAKLGKEHELMGKARVLIWLEQRWLYGFTEWYSNTYYKEDLLALSNLIDFAEDEEVVVKAQMIMDLLLYDLASQSYKGTFVSTSGRMYEDNKKSGNGNRLNRVAEYLFDVELGASEKEGGLDLNFIYMKNYELPGVIKEIAEDTSFAIIKASNGLDISELEDEDLLGQEQNKMMMQWGMEAFTNPEVIENSLEYIERHHMFSNEFLSDFKRMNIGALKVTSLLPTVSRVLNFKSNGIAIQRANTYTFRTNDYMMATAQNYHPGEFGDQQHIWTATLNNDVSIFTTHPSVPFSDEGALSGSPNYWVGSGRLPHSVQYEDINLSIYKIPNNKGFMEEALVDYTHAYVPQALMESVIVDGRYMFGHLGDTYIGMIGLSDLSYLEKSSDDLIQMGKVTYWVTELSSASDETFEAFRARIYDNEVHYEEHNDQLTYVSGGKELSLTYGDAFTIDGDILVTDYKRHESPYAVTERKADQMTFNFNDQYLELDFYQLKRVFGDVNTIE